MKKPFTILSLSILGFTLHAASAHAQTKPKNTSTPAKTSTAKPTPTPKQSTYHSEGVGTGAPKAIELKQVTTSDDLVTKEKLELDRLEKSATSPCEKQELELRRQDVEFYENNKKQIQEIIEQITKGLKKQRVLLSEFEHGSAENETVGDVKNAAGETEQSAVISFKITPEHGTEEVTKTIVLKDLIRYIRKFEAEAATVGNSSTEVEKFLDKYRDPKTANDKAYFNMTLEEAKKAYSVRLSSVFKVTLRQSQDRKLVIGEGKNVFAVSTSTVLGYNPTYGTQVGSNLSKNPGVNQNVSATMLQTFSEAFTNAKEEAYWNVIRAQQLTINGIPIDGLERRKYFDKMRDPNCQTTVYDFNEKSNAGPFLDYSDKKKCDNTGIEILSASLVSHDANGNESAFDLTSKLYDDSHRKYNYKLPNLSSQIPASLLKNDAELHISYRCGCSKAPVEINYVENLVIPQTTCGWGCGSTCNEHMVGWNYANLRSLLSQARAAYGQDVKIEMRTINDVRGWDVTNAMVVDTVHRTGGSSNDHDIMDLLTHITMIHVDSLPAASMGYRWDYQIVLPNGKRIIPANTNEISCPK